MCKREFTESQSVMQAHEARQTLKTAPAVETAATRQAGAAGQTANLPVCPMECGVLHFSCKGLVLECPVCGWHLMLRPDEARDIARAVAGDDSDLRIDLMLAEIARREFDALQEELHLHAEEADRLSAEWETVTAMAATLYQRWQSADSAHGAMLARFEAGAEPTARLLGISTKALLGYPPSAR